MAVDQSEVDTDLVAQSQTDGAPAEGADTAKTGKFFDKYEDLDAVGKAIHEKDATISRQGEENARIREQLAAAQQNAEIASALKGLTDAQKAERNSANEPDYDQYIAEIGEEFQSDPKAAARKLADLTAFWQSEGQKRINADRETMMAEINSKISSLTDGQVKLTPEYRENKDLIEVLMKDANLDLHQAMKMAGTVRKVAPTVMQRNTPPVSVSQSRVTSRDDGVSKYWDNAEERDQTVLEIGENATRMIEQDYERGKAS